MRIGDLVELDHLDGGDVGPGVASASAAVSHSGGDVVGRRRPSQRVHGHTQHADRACGERDAQW